MPGEGTTSGRTSLVMMALLSHHARLLRCIDEETTQIVELHRTTGTPIRFQVIATARCARST